MLTTLTKSLRSSSLILLLLFVSAEGFSQLQCTLTCPSAINVNNNTGACGAIVIYTPTTSGACGIVTRTPASGSFFPIGTTTVNVSSSTGRTCSFTVTVRDNEPPVFNSPNITRTADRGLCSAIVSNPTTATDNCGIGIISGTRSDGLSINSSPYPVGTTTIAWRATDIHGNTATKTETITVTDNEPPVITSVTASPNSLWPPNHKMVPVTVTITSRDNCGIASNGIIGVSSNEAVSRIGNGDKSPDWQIIDNTHVNLRSERFGKGDDRDGRVYTITVRSTDIHGNSSTATVPVFVAHDQKDKVDKNKDKDKDDKNKDDKNKDKDKDEHKELSVKVMNTLAGYVLIVNSENQGRITIRVVDVNGRPVETRENIVPGQTIFIGSNYHPGIYFVFITQGNRTKVIKIIK